MMLKDLYSCEHCMEVLSHSGKTIGVAVGFRHKCRGTAVVECVVVDTRDSEIQLVERDR